jgi:hypothetical protein
MRTPAKATNPKPRITQSYNFPAPTRGWISNENLANPTEGGAAVLENWFPTATGLQVRAGSELYATLGLGTLPVRSIFSYLNGTERKLFASTDEAIYDITNIITPLNYALENEDGLLLETDTGDTFGQDSTVGLEVLTGTTSGNWVVVQFATAGGVFLVGVNGEDNAFLYDGTDFFPISGQQIYRLNYDAETAPFTEGETLTGATSGATATILRVFDEGTTGHLWIQNITSGPFDDNETITDSGGGSATANGTEGTPIAPAITGIDTSDLSYVWIYKSRAWFVQKDSLSAWYLPIDSVGGAATEFPLGGVFGRGGSLLFGATWSLDSGASGGLSEQIVFVSTEGEVAVYQGINPGGGGDFSKVGVYRIGKPMGPKAFIRAGGDLVIATDIGFIPLSQAIQRDIAALSPNAVSFPIEVAWNDRVASRSAQPWHCEIWPTKQMTVVALPTVVETGPEMLIANARTGAWALYTGWDGGCLEVFEERLFFGSSNGRVVEAEVTGSDEGLPFVATVVPLFSDLGAPASLKTIGMARATMLSAYPLTERISIQANFTINLPPAPDSTLTGVQSVWGGGVWGQSQWGQQAVKKPQQRWLSVSGSGYSIAPALQITSGAIAPLNTELVRFDLTGMTADIVS